MRFAAVVLAAGQSTRMGSNKLLADLHGQPLIAATLSEIELSGVDGVIVVTGYQAAEVAAALATTTARLVHNPHYAAGLSTSIRCGIAAAQDFDAAFICLGDMPLIRSADLKAMRKAFNEGEERHIIALTYNGKRGHPVLWGRAHFASLMALAGDRGARHLLDANAAQITEIAVTHDGILRDADTPEALAEMRKRSAS